MRSQIKLTGFAIVLLAILVGSFLFVHPALFSEKAPVPKPQQKRTAPTMENWNNYVNAKYGYTIASPQEWPAIEFPDTKTGASFGDQRVVIDVAQKVPSLTNLSMEQYARSAATQEIQGFEKLNSIETVTTKSGLIGYRTTWVVLEMPFINASPNAPEKKTISQPITYFALPGNDLLVLTIRVNAAEVSPDDIYLYNMMINTLSFSK